MSRHLGQEEGRQGDATSSDPFCVSVLEEDDDSLHAAGLLLNLSPETIMKCDHCEGPALGALPQQVCH